MEGLGGHRFHKGNSTSTQCRRNYLVYNLELVERNSFQKLLYEKSEPYTKSKLFFKY